MTAAAQNVNSDAPSRTWDDVKIEALEARLKASGVTLPASPDADEMNGVTKTLSAHDPSLLVLLLGAVVEPLPGNAADRMEKSAAKAARVQKMKKAPGKMLSSSNHKGREKPDGKLIKWVVGGALAAGAIGFILFSPSGGAPAAVVKTAPGSAGAGAAPPGPGSTGALQPGGAPGVTVPAAGQQPAAPVSASGLVGANPPLPSPVAALNTVMTSPVGSSMPGPVSGGVASLPPVPAPVSPASMPVPPRTLQPPARLTYGTPRLLSISNPAAARENRVVSSAGVSQAPVSAGIVAKSALVASRVVAASPVSAGASAQGLSRQTQGQVGQAESPSAQSGIVSAASGRAAVPGTVREGLVSAASSQGAPGDTRAAGLVGVSQTPAETGAPSGMGAPSTAGLVSIAHQGQPLSEPAPGAASGQAATVMGAAPALSIPASPYSMGSQLKAVINIGALFASPVGDSGQGSVLQGQDQQLVYATAEDGSAWRGTPRLLSSGRIGVSFDRVMVKGAVLRVLADATDDSGLPGVAAQSRTDSPKAASELFQALLSGARTFAQASLQGDTSITSSGTIVNQSARPNFWVTLGGALAGSLSLPSPRITQLDVITLSKGTPIVLVVRGEE